MVGSVPVGVPVAIFTPVPLLPPRLVPEMFTSVPDEAELAVTLIAPVPV